MTVYSESISFFIAYIFVFTMHIFHSDYDSYQCVNMLQRLPHSLTVVRLLHKYAYSLIKYCQNVA